jgi:hypothetical protein
MCAPKPEIYLSHHVLLGCSSKLGIFSLLKDFHSENSSQELFL